MGEKINRHLSVTLDDANLFLKTFRGSSKVINLLLSREFAECASEPEKIARAALLYRTAAAKGGGQGPSGQSPPADQRRKVHNFASAFPKREERVAGIGRDEQNRSEEDNDEMSEWFS